MSELLGCLGLLWAAAIVVGIIMIEWSLSRIMRAIERKEAKR